MSSKHLGNNTYFLTVFHSSAKKLLEFYLATIFPADLI